MSKESFAPRDTATKSVKPTPHPSSNMCQSFQNFGREPSSSNQLTWSLFLAATLEQGIELFTITITFASNTPMSHNASPGHVSIFAI